MSGSNGKGRTLVAALCALAAIQPMASGPTLAAPSGPAPATLAGGPPGAPPARFDRLMAASPRDGAALYDVAVDLLRAGEYDRAGRAFEAAAAAGRREGTALYNAACARALGGRKEEALALLRRALDAGFDDPSLMKEDDDLASLRSDPRFPALVRDAELLTMKGTWTVSGWALRSKRVADSEEAAARFRAYLKDHPESGRAWYGLGYVQLQGDRERESVDSFRRALDLGYRRPATAYNLACAHARLGEKDRAFEWLDRAIEAGFTSASQLRDDDDLDSLRGDPRFRRAVENARARASEKAAGARSEED